MASKTLKSGFISGIRYLDCLQSRGQSFDSVQLINRRFEFGKSLYCKNLYAHYGCVNAVEFSNDGEWLASGGDDKRVLLWNVDRTLSSCYQPKAMKGEHNSNIFCLGFNSSRTKLFSAGNDEQVILHDVNTADVGDVFLHDEAVYCLSVNPANDNLFLSACDDGRVLMWDVRLTTGDPSILASCSSPYHTVSYNPAEPHYVATGSARDGVCLWDTRKPRTVVMKCGFSKGAMSVRFNAAGTHLLALRRRLPPVLYDMTSGACVAEFDHPEYYNSCTMKSCCFAGNRDQYVLSGSDDFKLYAWKVPRHSEGKKMWVHKAHFVLRGHRSIVNQVRYNNAYGLLASSGVEKIVKLWSSFQLSHNEEVDRYISANDLNRKVYTHEEYINLVLESGQFMTHDYSHHSVQEDQRMMAFFDSLVQRDIEGWTSDSIDTKDIAVTSLVIPSDEFSDSSSSSEFASGSESVCEWFSSECFQAKRETESSDDKISQLIAKKCKEAKLKLLRRNQCAFRDSANGQDSKYASVEIGPETNQKQKTVSMSLGKDLHSGAETSCSLMVLKDKRKLFQKKRVKLTKNDCFDDSSSDSDLNNGLISLKDISQILKQGTAEVGEPVPENKETNMSSDQDGISEDNVRNTDSKIRFCLKKSKHANRNYRKRSAEDREDE